MKIKKLCTLKKNEIASKMKKIVKIVKKPHFICEKCLRTSKEEKYLCSPKKL